jgi:hypothetical protein
VHYTPCNDVLSPLDKGLKGSSAHTQQASLTMLQLALNSHIVPGNRVDGCLLTVARGNVAQCIGRCLCDIMVALEGVTACRCR